MNENLICESSILENQYKQKIHSFCHGMDFISLPEQAVSQYQSHTV